MALQQLPVIEATIQVVHSGSMYGEAFTLTLDGSDGAPMAPQQTYTLDLTVFAPDLVALGVSAPHVEVYREATGDKVEVDITVEEELITIRFWAPVEPAEYRVKVIG